MEWILRWITGLMGAYLLGKLVSEFKLPSVIGWLLSGMIFGPYALDLLSTDILNSQWYSYLISIFEVTAGIMVGTDLVWSRLKKTGKSLVGITIAESLTTFLVVCLFFGVIFYFAEIPFYLAIIFGGIALATAPIPSFSVVNEYNTAGPVTEALKSVAVLDDVVALVIFFSMMAILSGTSPESAISPVMIPVILIAPILIGLIPGFIGGYVFKRIKSRGGTLLTLVGLILFTTLVGIWANSLMETPALNYLLMGMTFSATFANMVPASKVNQIVRDSAPILNLAFLAFIMNLGAPLDYRLITSAGLYTVVYIVSRAIGKYGGTYLGASLTGAPKTVQKYLGLTLLPHSGVSLIFTGIAANFLSKVAPSLTSILVGTIAAAAIINEIIAVILAKQAFVMAGEIGKGEV